MPERAPQADSPTPPALRILHLPTDTGGHPSGLAAAERSLGHDSTTLVFGRSGIGYPVDVNLDLTGRSRIGRLRGRVAALLQRIGRYDVVHGNFGMAFLPPVGGLGPDLALLRAAGATVFVTFQGCDARQQQWCTQHREISCCGGREGPGLCRPEQDSGKRAFIRAADRWAHGVFCLNPDLLEVVPGATFVPYASIDPDVLRPESPATEQPPRAASTSDRRTERPVRIVHAPTSRLVKGTDAVLAARDRIQERIESDLSPHPGGPAAAEAPRYEWDLVEGVTHEAALARYRHADILIDQLRIGWYGALAVEAMALGKPVVAWIEPADLQHVPAAMAAELPIVVAREETVAQVVSELACDPARRADLGRRGRSFVERWHHPRRIAAAMAACARERNGAAFWSHYDPDQPIGLD